MALTDDQRNWAEEHVGKETTVTDGVVESWTELEDGQVKFITSFTARPPASPEQLAEQAAAREAEEQALAEQRAAARNAEIEAVVEARLRERELAQPGR